MVKINVTVQTLKDLKEGNLSMAEETKINMSKLLLLEDDKYSFYSKAN